VKNRKPPAKEWGKKRTLRGKTEGKDLKKGETGRGGTPANEERVISPAESLNPAATERGGGRFDRGKRRQGARGRRGEKLCGERREEKSMAPHKGRKTAL